MMEIIGNLLGTYKILEVIGSGGFGTVYTARHTQTKEIVAVKVLNPKLSNRPDFKERFLQEAHLLRSLPEHPHIVGLREFGEALGQPYLVMEYLAGQDLRDLLEDGPLTVKQALSIANQAADALEAASRGGLVHCDIKPENLKVLPGGMVMVMDFGIARAVDTNLRLDAGTPTYMAPELWRYEQPAAATDIYALGCVLYEMLTGHVPFVCSNPDDPDLARKEMEQCHQFTIPDWRPFQDMNLPGLLELLEGMLAKSSKSRPPAKLVMEQLRQLEGLVAADLRLPQIEIKTVDDRTRLRDIEDIDLTQIKEQADIDATILRPLPSPQTPSQITTTPSRPDFDRLATGVPVSVQRHLASLDLGEDVCRAALIYEGALYTGTLDGRICQLDLSSGHIQRWNVVPRAKVRSLAWGFAAYPDRILLHTGDLDWIEVNTQNGQVIRRGKLPESEVIFNHSSGWLYMFGSRQKFYRSPLKTLENPEQFDVMARITGPAHITHGSVFVPTAAGLVWIDTGSRRADLIGPRQTARAVSAIHDKRLVTSYSTVADDGVQHTILRLFEISVSPARVLCDVDVTGKGAGPVQIFGERVILACSDGWVRAWDVSQIDKNPSFQPAWSECVGAGRGLQSNAALNGGVLALTSTKDNVGELMLLNAFTGKSVSDYPLSGDVFLAPLWWQKTLSIITADGRVEVFRVTFETGDS